MGLELEYEPGQTPLDEEEKDGLIPYAETRGDLDELEQENIGYAIAWSQRIRPAIEEILTEEFICRVHARMFANVWNWAGTYRRTNKNIGVDKYEIAIQLRNACDDCRFWIEHATFEPDEIAVRFKHRIVSIHPFANGNGRHSRLIADLLITKHFKRMPFSWGGAKLVNASSTRQAYLSALRHADSGDPTPLIQFARS